MSVKFHGRRSRVKGQARHKPRRAARPLRAKDMRGWQPSGWTPDSDAPCAKVTYPNRLDAQAMASFEQRVYRCPACRGWHVTSFKPNERTA